MPKSKLHLPPLKLISSESFGERLSRIRKERGLTQVQLAKKIGLTQALITAYECGRLRMHAEMLARFALALDVSGDDLLGLPRGSKKAAPPGVRLSLKLVRRLQKIEKLSGTQQKVLLHTIDVFLRGSDQRASS